MAFEKVLRGWMRGGLGGLRDEAWDTSRGVSNFRILMGTFFQVVCAKQLYLAASSDNLEAGQACGIEVQKS